MADERAFVYDQGSEGLRLYLTGPPALAREGVLIVRSGNDEPDIEILMVRQITPRGIDRPNIDLLLATVNYLERLRWDFEKSMIDLHTQIDQLGSRVREAIDERGEARGETYAAQGELQAAHELIATLEKAAKAKPAPKARKR